MMSDTAATFVWLDQAGRTVQHVDYRTPEWHDSLAWAKSYGIDTMRVPKGATIIVDTFACQIHYPLCRQDENGRVIVENGELVTDGVTEQLEGPPLPLGHPMTLGGQR